MTNEPLRANPEDRPVPPSSQGAPAMAEAASAMPAGAPGSLIRPIGRQRPARPSPLRAWPGFLLGGLGIGLAVALAVLLWRVAGAPVPPAPAALAAGDLVELETLLEQLGFPPGKLDGVVDADCIAAIRDFQETAGLPVDGAPSVALLEELRAALRELSGG